MEVFSNSIVPRYLRRVRLVLVKNFENRLEGGRDRYCACAAATEICHLAKLMSLDVIYSLQRLSLFMINMSVEYSMCSLFIHNSY